MDLCQDPSFSSCPLNTFLAAPKHLEIDLDLQRGEYMASFPCKTTIANITNDEGNAIEFGTTLFIVHKVLPPIIILVGLVGNVLAFLILSQPKYANQSTCFYMRMLAVFDTMELLFLNLQRYTLWIFPDLFSRYGCWFCKEYMPLFHFTLTNSHWTVVFMTIDRFIAVTFPLRSLTLCTKRRARHTLIALFVVSISVNPLFVFSTFNPHAIVLKEKCAFENDRIEFIAQTVVLSTIFFIPLLVVLCLNIIIVTTVLTRRYRHHRLGLIRNRSDGSDVTLSSLTSRDAKERQLTAMLLLVSGVFVLALAPYSIDYFIWLKVKDPDELRGFLYEISATMMTINPAVNFYMYMLSCRKFRDDLRKLIGCGTMNTSSPEKGSSQNNQRGVKNEEIGTCLKCQDFRGQDNAGSNLRECTTQGVYTIPSVDSGPYISIDF